MFNLCNKCKSDLNRKNIDKCEIEKFINDNNLYYYECS